MARKPRNLNDEERALWADVARRTTPIHPPRPVVEDDPQEKTLSQPKKPILPPRIRVGERAVATPPPHDIADPIEARIAAQPVTMDRKRFQRMKQGKLSPEARIDLHGMTLAQAHPALTRFILNAVEQDRRLVLVITGKGKTRDGGGPIPERHGVLRHQVPHWLRTPPLAAHVLQLTEAHRKHGGMGAYYVYLRRNR